MPDHITIPAQYSTEHEREAYLGGRWATLRTSTA
jgi:hypothetical protein